MNISHREERCIATLVREILVDRFHEDLEKRPEVELHEGKFIELTIT